MKLALCLEYPIGMRGGVSVLVEILLKEFAGRGHEIVLVSDDTAETLRASDVGSLVTEHLSWNPRNITRRSARKLAEQLANAKPDLAHFHIGGTYGFGNRWMWSCPIPMLARRGVPCVTTVHMANGLLDGFCGPQKPLWFKLLMLPIAWCGKAWQVKHTLFEIVVSLRDRDKLRQWYLPFATRFVQIYHSRLRAHAVERTNVRHPVVLNVGHVAWRKGQAVLAEAFARIAADHGEWKLLLAGHDSGDGAVERIRQIAETSKLTERIALLGQRADAAELMQRAAIFVQPSFHEGLPLALQEALFNRCACLATRIPGNVELVEHDSNGLLVTPGKPEEMAQALNRLLNDAVLRDRFAARAHADILAKGMTIENMIERHADIYESAIQQS